jgi:hypothetical protein
MQLYAVFFEAPNSDYSTLIRYPKLRAGTHYEIPQSVTEIASSAFTASTLNTIILPASVSLLGRYAFNFCGELKSINLPEGIEVLPPGLFNGCISLPSVSLPESLITIKQSAFSSCYALENIEIPKNVSEIEFFDEDSDRVRSGVLYTLSIDNFGWGSPFTSTKSLRSINVAQDNPSYASVEGVLFDKEMTTLLYYPISKPDKHYEVAEGIRYIEDKSFRSNKYLKSIVLPSSLVQIRNEAFTQSESLAQVTFAEGLLIIGFCAFLECKALQEAVLPESLLCIGNGAFASCSSLRKLVLPQTKMAYANSSMVWFSYYVVIHGQPGSFAETVAKNNKKPFVAIETDR